jgi:hypothetical protein
MCIRRKLYVDLIDSGNPIDARDALFLSDRRAGKSLSRDFSFRARQRLDDALAQCGHDPNA